MAYILSDLNWIKMCFVSCCAVGKIASKVERVRALLLLTLKKSLDTLFVSAAATRGDLQVLD